MIIDHNHIKYQRRWVSARENKWNGAYYYSQEITRNIIPLVHTDRNWVTINVEGYCYDHSIVFIHNNMYPKLYDWLSGYDDLILVCGVPGTCSKVAHLGHAVYLPLSVDVEEVEKFRSEKTEDTAFFGRTPKRAGITFPEETHIIENLPRSELLRRMSAYRRVYAVGRTAIEARILGCEILPYDPRFPDPSVWEVVDNREAASMLQEILDVL